MWADSRVPGQDLSCIGPCETAPEGQGPPESSRGCAKGTVSGTGEKDKLIEDIFTSLENGM